MEKKWKELIAIRNYNSVWQCLWVNGAHISKLPLLNFSHQPLLPSSCKWKVPIALHSRQRQLPSGLWKKRDFGEYVTRLSSTFHLKENTFPFSHPAGAAQVVACFLPRSHQRVGTAPQSPVYTAPGSLTEHFNNSAVATTACSTMFLAMADEVERKSTRFSSSLFQLFLEIWLSPGHIDLHSYLQTAFGHPATWEQSLSPGFKFQARWPWWWETQPSLLSLDWGCQCTLVL